MQVRQLLASAWQLAVIVAWLLAGQARQRLGQRRPLQPLPLPDAYARILRNTPFRSGYTRQPDSPTPVGMTSQTLNYHQGQITPTKLEGRVGPLAPA